jgi:hypothetical protein
MIEPIPVYWQNQLIGHLYNVQVDMWYCEGDWAGLEIPFPAFYDELQGLTPIGNFEAINTNLEKKLWVGIGQNKPTHLIYAFGNNHLAARLVIHSPNEW